LEHLVTNDDIQLLQKFHNQEQEMEWTPEELVRLDYLDLYLDIPSICDGLVGSSGVTECINVSDRELLKKFFIYIQHRFYSKQHIFLPHDIDRLLLLDDMLDIPIIRAWYYQIIEIDFNRRYQVLQRLSPHIKKKPSFADYRFADIAIYDNHLNVFIMCYDPVYAARYDMDCTAASFGRVDMLRHMYTLGFQFTAKTSRRAAVNDQYETLLFLHSVNCPWDYKLHWSDTNLFIFLYKNIREWSIPLLRQALFTKYHFDVIDYAIAKKDTTFNLLLWAVKRDMKLRTSYTLKLCSTDNKWLTTRVMHIAIQKQNKWLVKELLKKNCPTNSQCYHKAISVLRPDFVSLLYKSGCPLDATCYQINPLKKRIFSMMKVMREYPKIAKLLQKYKCPYQGSDLPNQLKAFHNKKVL
jgi:hypothetical protein